MLHELETPAFWHELFPDSIVTLRDEQTLNDAMKNTGLPTPQEYTITERRVLEVEELNAQWILFRLTNATSELWLLAECVGPTVELGVFYEPVPPGTRAEWLNQGHYWLFQQPSGDWVPADLEYTAGLSFTEEDGREVAYELSQGPYHGEAQIISPADDGSTAIFASVAEYTATADSRNPLVRIMEFGGTDNPDGGLLHVFVGARLSKFDLSVLPQ